MVTATLEKPKLEIVVKNSWVPEDLDAKIRRWNPKSQLGHIIKEIMRFNIPAELKAELYSRITSVLIGETKLEAVVIRGIESRFRFGKSLIEDYGIVSTRVVTNAGIDFIVDAFQNNTEIENLKYHALGTGTTAEAAADTALVTELTTEYTGNVRATGTTAETGAGPAAYRTVGTNTLDSGTPILREHGIFDQAATGGGTLLDRSVFAAITLDGTAGDSLQTTYTLTMSAGG